MCKRKFSSKEELNGDILERERTSLEYYISPSRTLHTQWLNSNASNLKFWWKNDGSKFKRFENTCMASFIYLDTYIVPQCPIYLAMSR